jgi:cell division septation protein DedD
MDSIKLGAPAEESNSAEPMDSYGPDTRKKTRNPILMMILVLCLGLLVSSVYLGGRFSSVHASVALAKPAAFANQKKSNPAISPAAVSSAVPTGKKQADAKSTPAPKPAIAAAQKATPAPAIVASQKSNPAQPSVIAAAQKPTPVPVLVAAQKSTPAPLPAIVASQKSNPASPSVIVAVKKSTPAPTPAAKPVPAPASVTVAAKRPEPTVGTIALPPLPKESLPTTELAHPKSGKAYVQVGAFVSPYAERWVDVLEQRGFRPIVADGPNSVIHRVLLGPFGPSEVSAVEAKLRQAGIDHFEKVY